MNLEQNSKLSLVDAGFDTELKVTFSENTAHYGGAVYINDNVSPACKSKYFTKHTVQTECFLLAYKLDKAQKLIKFSENLASMAGSAGLLDRCTISSGYTEDLFDSGVQQQVYGLSFLIGLSNLQPTEIASNPVRVCFCFSGSLVDCNHDIPFKVLKRGEKLSVSLVAVDQVNHTINATIYSAVGSVRGVDSTRRLHDIDNICTNLSFRVFPESNQVVLYAIGPCNNTGISQRVIKLDF